MKVDTGWFNDLIKRSPYGSQRRFSRKLRGRHGKSLDPSALSLMLRGKRAMQLFEARQFADLLDVPLIEVLRHAGIALPEEGTRTVPVSGYIDKDAAVHLSSGRNQEAVAGPGDMPSEAIALRWMTSNTEHEIIDGWLVFAEKPGPPRPEIVGRFCIVCPRKGKPAVGFVQRGYKAGTYNFLNGIHGFTKRLENVQFEWVSPVLWVRPQQ